MKMKDLICPQCLHSVKLEDSMKIGDFPACENCKEVFEVINNGTLALDWPDDGLLYTSRKTWFQKI